MKKLNIILINIITALLLTGIALATPGIPHQFFGSVTVNGAPAADNIPLEAKIDGGLVAATLTKSGEYGYSPYIFYVQDPDGTRYGDTIVFYVDGVKAAEYTFNNGQSTELNLAITKKIETKNTGGSPSSSSTPSSASSSASDDSEEDNSTAAAEENSAESTENLDIVCVPEWKCTDYMDCINGIQKRVCYDINDCNTDNGKPIETAECEMSEEPFKQSVFGSITGAVIGGGAASWISLLIIIGIIGGFAIFRFAKK